MNGTDKVMAELGGKPVIWYAIRAFDLNPGIHEILVVTREDLIQPIAQMCRDHEFTKVRAVLTGGADRTESVLIGAEAADPKSVLIAVHDGARPLVSQRIITETAQRAAEFGAAAPAVPVKDTVKITDRGTVESTPDRAKLAAVQTPQIFDADLLRAALTAAKERDEPVTDDCTAVEKLGMRVFLTEGEERNLKLTTPLDLEVAELLLAKEGSL